MAQFCVSFLVRSWECKVCWAWRPFIFSCMVVARYVGPFSYIIYTHLAHSFFWRTSLVHMATLRALIRVVAVISIVVTTWWCGWGMILRLMFEVVNVIFLIEIWRFIWCVVFKLPCRICSIWWIQTHGVHFYSVGNSGIPGPEPERVIRHIG